MKLSQKKCMLGLLVIFFGMAGESKEAAVVWLEAESFDHKGGWVIDQQSMDVLGSPYLMAHGMGVPVADASTTIRFPETGSYRLFVRTRNWTAPWSDHAAGRFQLRINGNAVETEFGTGSGDWNWSDGGIIQIKHPETLISLHDLSGFNGRCDVILFTKELGFKPPSTREEMATWRTKLTDTGLEPEEQHFDFVVVGGGMAGTCAAISAARLGVKVALIQNRPVLGGNNSSEVRVHLGARIKLEPYPALGDLVNEIGPTRGGNARPEAYYEDEKKLKAVLDETNIKLFLNYHANQVIVKGNSIEKVVAQNLESGRKLSFTAPLFADCTGDASLGYLAGAEFMSGRESKDTFNEPTAPDTADKLGMGLSVQWYAEETNQALDFPDITWGLPWSEEKTFAIKRGDWDWETGMGKDMTRETEFIRDYGLLVVYSNWSFLKNHHSEKDNFRNEKLVWVAYIGGKRESRRLVGDYILTENELIGRKTQPDGTAPTTWTIDLHYPDPENLEKFEGEAFRSIAKHIPIHPYPIPYRCLYSKNVHNLMMAGRNISVSHVALGTVRLMRTGGMMGEVIGMAASLCKEHRTTPRGVYQDHLPDLKERMTTGVGDASLPFTQDYNLGGTLMEEK